MREILGAERDALILQVLNRIDGDTQKIAAPDRVYAWERGWTEALYKFRADPREEALVPAFVRMGQPVRFQQNYWMPENPDYELNHIRAMQKNVLAEVFKDCSTVYEFGAGTGYNLVALARLLPRATFRGYDFVPPAVDLLNEVGFQLKLPITGGVFDMAHPVHNPLNLRCGVLTFGAVEQIGGSEAFKPFIEYLIEQKPKVVLHVEPTIELYDETNLIDALAIRFHRKRGYTTGLLPYLQQHPKVQLHKVERGYFGSLMLEAYNQIIWSVK